MLLLTFETWDPSTTSQSVSSRTLVAVFALSALVLSVLGCGYILCVSFFTRDGREKVFTDISARLPVILGISDFFFALSHGIDHIYSLIYGNTFTGAPCRFLATWSCFFAGCAVVYTSLIAALVYMAVHHRYCLEFGWLDWKLHLAAFLITFPLQVIPSITVDSHDAAEYWCLFSHTHFEGIVVELLSALVVTTGQLFCLFVYTRVVSTLRKSKVRAGAVSDQYGQTVNVILYKASKRVMSYMMVVTVQYSFFLPYSLMYIYGIRDSMIFALIALSFNLGGFLNFCVFFYRRRLERQKDRLIRPMFSGFDNYTGQQQLQSHKYKYRSPTVSPKANAVAPLPSPDRTIFGLGSTQITKEDNTAYEIPRATRSPQQAVTMLQLTPSADPHQFELRTPWPTPGKSERLAMPAAEADGPIVIAEPMTLN